jgi:putative flippase GtrA
MVKQGIKYFWTLRREFAKYFIVGFGSLLLDMGTLILFTEVFGFIPWISVIINQAIVLSINFTLNKYWSFRNKAMPHKQIMRYIILAGWNYMFSVVTMFILNGQFEFDYRLVRIVSIAIMVSWNFFLYKYWVYKNEERVVASEMVVTDVNSEQGDQSQE